MVLEDAKRSGTKSEPAEAGPVERPEEIYSPPARGTSCRDRRINLRKEAKRAVPEAASDTALEWYFYSCLFSCLPVELHCFKLVYKVKALF